MIALNLLPDVKLDYLKTERQQRLIAAISFIITAAAVALLVLLLLYDGLQKKHLSDLSKDISTESSQIQSEPQISKILTVQNQLESLTSLHDQEPAASRLFTYLNEVTPASVSISTVTSDFTLQTVIITGQSTDLTSVNQFVDTLKLTNYTQGQTTTNQQPAFNNVVLTSFGINSATSGSTSQDVNYTISLSFDKTIFNTTKQISLVVPSTTVTHATGAQSSTLFNSAAGSAGSN